MLLTYAALYFEDLIMALSSSPKYLQPVNLDTAAGKIDRSRLYFVYYCKRTGRAIKRAMLFFISTEGLITSGSLALMVGWVLGIWAITTKSRLPDGPRISAVVGFAIGFPAITIMWAKILNDDEYYKKVRKPGLIALPLYVHFGVFPSPSVQSPEV